MQSLEEELLELETKKEEIFHYSDIDVSRCIEVIVYVGKSVDRCKNWPNKLVKSLSKVNDLFQQEFNIEFYYTFHLWNDSQDLWALYLKKYFSPDFYNIFNLSPDRPKPIPISNQNHAEDLIKEHKERRLLHKFLYNLNICHRILYEDASKKFALGITKFSDITEIDSMTYSTIRGVAFQSVTYPVAVITIRSLKKFSNDIQHELSHIFGAQEYEEPIKKTLYIFKTYSVMNVDGPRSNKWDEFNKEIITQGYQRYIL